MNGKQVQKHEMDGKQVQTFKTSTNKCKENNIVITLNVSSPNTQLKSRNCEIG